MSGAPFSNTGGRFGQPRDAKATSRGYSLREDRLFSAKPAMDIQRVETTRRSGSCSHQHDEDCPACRLQPHDKAMSRLVGESRLESKIPIPVFPQSHWCYEIASACR